MTELTAEQKIARISSQRHVRAAAAVDTVPLLAARIDALLWWGRRMSVAHRYLEGKGRTELEVGLVLACDTTSTHMHARKDWATYTVRFDKLGRHVGFSAYTHNDAGTEEAVWKRWRAGDRRDLTVVELQGGGPGDSGPSSDEWIVITDWNQFGVGQEWTIGFDTEAYYESWSERENRGYALAEAAWSDKKVPVRTCTAFVELSGGHHHQVSRGYRVRCGGPLAGDACAWADDHIERTAAL